MSFFPFAQAASHEINSFHGSESASLRSGAFRLELINKSTR
jgi:hypothetical protein